MGHCSSFDRHRVNHVRLFLIKIILLSANSGQHQFPPDDIITQSREMVMKINKHQRKKCFDLLSNSLN